MPYITSIERIGMEKGLEQGLAVLRQGLLQILSARWENCASEFAERIQSETDLDRLGVLLQRAALANSLDEFKDAMRKDKA